MIKVELAKYPVLRQLMGKYRLNAGDIATIINKSHRQTINKLNQTESPRGKKLLFDIQEAYDLVDFFRKQGEIKLTSEILFFASEFSNKNNNETKSA